MLPQAGEGGEESSDSDGEQEETSHKLIRKVSTSGQIRAKVGHDLVTPSPNTPSLTTHLQHDYIFKAGFSKVAEDKIFSNALRTRESSPCSSESFIEANL